MGPPVILAANDHELMKLVRARIEAQYPLAFIAQELDVDVHDLIHWIMDVYKAPRKGKEYQNKAAGPIGQPKRASSPWSPAESVRRHTAWERQRAGAAETRRMLEVSGR